MENEDSELRVVAAFFADPAEAQAAETDLRGQLDVEPADISVQPVGGDPSRRGLATLLAGRFRAHRKPIVQRVIEAHRGEIAVDVAEARVRPATRTAPSTR